MLSTDLYERHLVDALPVTVFSLDTDGRLTSWHIPAARSPDEGSAASGIALTDESRGRVIWDIANTGLVRDQVQHAMRVLRAGRAPVARWEMNHAAGDRRVSVVLMAPMHDETHAVTGFVIAVTDMTSSLRPRDAIHDAGLALALMLEPDRVYQEAAHQLRQALRPDLVVIALADDASARARLVYESGSDVDRRALEHRFAATWRTAIDERRFLTSRVDSSLELSVPLDAGNGPVGVITVVVDDVESPERVAEATRFLTSLAKNAAVALERSRQVEHVSQRRRNDSIGQVAAGVAHELRNPIFGISSAAQLLRFRAREDPVVEKNVGRILREVERLNRMVSTLLELGRPVALKRAAGDPDTIWDDVLVAERGRLESRAVAVRRTRAEPSASVEMDAQQLAQTFMSIVSNAVDAAPEATDIILQSTVLPNGAWRCRLMNTGEPIAPDMLPRVFEPFVSTKPGSPGVGLALARRVVEEHGGGISIESSVEEGTTVSITLPGAPRNATLP